MKQLMLLLTALVLSVSALANGHCMTRPDYDASKDPSCQPIAQFVPVLIYHHVSDDKAPGETIIKLSRFVEHLDALHAAGYNTINISTLDEFMRGKIDLPAKTIAITLDDGWRNNVLAAQALKRRGMTATFFIISGYLNDPLHLSKNDVAALSNDGFEIGSHTHTHFTQWANDLSKLQLSIMLAEARLSRLILEDLVGKPVKSIAWPYGHTTLASAEGALSLGYTSTSIVSSVAKNSPGNSSLEIHRLNIDGHCTAQQVLSMVETGSLVPCTR